MDESITFRPGHLESVIVPRDWTPERLRFECLKMAHEKFSGDSAINVASDYVKFVFAK